MNKKEIYIIIINLAREATRDISLALQQWV